MMPPQAEASLALEYSTDTRKLGGGTARWATRRTEARPHAPALQPAAGHTALAHQNMMVATA